MTRTLWVKNFLLNFQEAAHRENGTECPDEDTDTHHQKTDVEEERIRSQKTKVCAGQVVPAHIKDEAVIRYNLEIEKNASSFVIQLNK